MSRRGGALIDESRPLRFSFDGRRMTGFEGDTLASALLANGVRIVARSFKYRRPRGIVAAGAEEPNALVTLGEGAEAIPNLKATRIPLTDGLVARSQRGAPSVRHDLGAVIGLFGPLLPPGFYYKTFMRPRPLRRLYERVLRRAAASAKVSTAPDPAQHLRRTLHTDVLVVGSGPAGLAAAGSALDTGASVVVAESEANAGGCLWDDPTIVIDGRSGAEWRDDSTRRLADHPRATLLTRTTVFGRYGGGQFAAHQLPGDGFHTEVFWDIRAKATVLATGAIERPLLFAGNDRPGVMLASAAASYVARQGVVPGRRVVVITNNDTAYDAAATVAASGTEVVAVVDTRDDPRRRAPEGAASLTGATGAAVRGTRGVRSVRVEAEGRTQRLPCDLVCMSGGWTPTIHLHSHRSDPIQHDHRWQAFVPVEGGGPVVSAGAAAGTAGLAAVLADGTAAGRRAAIRAGAPDTGTEPPPPTVGAERSFGDVAAPPPAPLAGRGKVFVDLATDVHHSDIEISMSEGYRGVEHVKRYTTLGMGPDQGKTGSVNAMGVVATGLGTEPARVGVTSYRPPYTPVSLGTLASAPPGRHLAPIRRTPIHDRHRSLGATFMPSALWLRPQHYGASDDVVVAAAAEASNVRTNVGITDVSTLGKIDLRGKDVAELLNLVYVNGWKSLAVGKVRYGVMLRDDGYVFDDGTTSRLAEDHYVMTTTTGNAEAVLAHLEFYHQRVWPHLDVRMTDVTEQWAVVALAGPNSRTVLQRLLPSVDVSDGALPFMGLARARVDEHEVRIFRISFSGELAYEVAVPANGGAPLWDAALEAGADLGIAPYGLEAMDYLRIEKGHLVVGMDIDGRVTPHDLGLGRMCSSKKDFVGRRSLENAVLTDLGRQRLAGLVSADDRMITAGAQLVRAPFDGEPQESVGRVTSRAYSPALGRPIALGLIAGGPDRYPDPVHAVSPVTGDQAEVEVVAPVFYDPDGQRMRG